MEADTTIILNPTSGGGKNADIVRRLAKERPHWTLVETDMPGDAMAAAKDASAQGRKQVVAAGGDGTINEVINGIMSVPPEKRATFGVLPCGSANDFGKSFSIAPDLDVAASVIDTRRRVPMTLVQLEGGKRQYYANAATGGFSAEIQEEMDESTKKWWGGFSYFRVAAEIMPKARNYRVRVTVDGRSYEKEVMAVVVANGKYAGGVEMVPAADPCADRLDVVLVLAVTMRERAKLLGSFAVGQQLESEHVLHLQGSRVEVRSDPSMPFIVDGEDFGSSPLKFSTVRDAIQVLAPERGK